MTATPKFEVLPNLRLVIHYDQYAESPRDWGNIGTMIFRATKHLRNDNPAGDGDYDDPVHSLRDMLNALCEVDDDYGDDADLLREFNRRFVAFALSYHGERGSATVMPTAFTAEDLDDADGIIYVSRDALREQNINSGDAAEYLRSECQTYSEWLSGEVYGFVIQDDDGSIHDSCGGFYGSDFENNGMKDHLPEELWPELINPTIHS